MHDPSVVSIIHLKLNKIVGCTHANKLKIISATTVLEFGISERIAHINPLTVVEILYIFSCMYVRYEDKFNDRVIVNTFTYYNIIIRSRVRDVTSDNSDEREVECIINNS